MNAAVPPFAWPCGDPAVISSAERLMLVAVGTGVGEDEAAVELGMTASALTAAHRVLRTRFGTRTTFGAFEAARALGLLDDIPAGGQWWWLAVEIGDQVQQWRVVGGFFAFGAFADENAARAALRCLASYETEGRPVWRMRMRRRATASAWRDVDASPSCDQVPVDVRAALARSMRRWTLPHPSSEPATIAPGVPATTAERRVPAAVGGGLMSLSTN